jgi:hypothetical protein
MARDYTLKDNNRRNIEFNDVHYVENALPSYFAESHPKLISFLNSYYQFEDSDGQASALIHDVMKARDITATPDSLLDELEDELLLGSSYFQGFTNKRAAAKFSNTLYRSKGTQYSIEQFFRMFFNTAPVVRYTKEDRFIVGESNVGFESQKFITDDKLYQTFALLIRIGIPISQWREVYKLFVHPAGMYFAGQVLIESFEDPFIPTEMPDFIKSTDNPTVQGEATMGMQAFADLTGIIVDSDGAPGYHRLDTTQFKYYDSDTTAAVFRTGGEGIIDLIGPNSPTFDDSADSDGATLFDQSVNLFDTFDEVKYVWYDSDSA